MTVALFFGSFNPIHIGHLIIANSVVNSSLAQQVWFVVSPHNPHKPLNVLATIDKRIHWVKQAIHTQPFFKCCDVELNLPTPSYTINTLNHLVKLYPHITFQLLLGQDAFEAIPTWKEGDYILKHFHCLIYKRLSHTPQLITHPHHTILQTPYLDISASLIRQYIKQNKSIQYLVPDNIKDEIDKYFSTT